MINWFNSNQGFVMIILTFAYVVATIIIVVYSSKSTKEMKITRENELRPYIFGQFTKFNDYNNMIDFQIRNSGKTGGIIKEIVVTPEFPLVDKNDKLNLLENFVLAPNQLFTVQLFGKIKDLTSNIYKIHIKYQAIGSTRSYTEDYKIPLVAYALMGHSYTSSGGISDEANAMKNIASILSSINKRI
ncbi:hypothetical protein [uncultured Sphaerochaeta sp.]|uniref:hypothetical protein n=1 Tax=uncultured Sphaerochaeta sp. TaxID=886478 RepID=UPI002A0A2AAA|nr:hypothetical protein [uncultured Sphaerochaeta sp.]